MLFDDMSKNNNIDKNDSSEKTDSKYMIKKADILLVVILLVIAIFALIGMKLFRKNGKVVLVQVDGAVVKELSLDKNESYKLETDKGTNTIVVKNGEVYVVDADCPDKICEGYKPISKKGEAIICLPHKLVVEISGGN